MKYLDDVDGSKNVYGFQKNKSYQIYDGNMSRLRPLHNGTALKIRGSKVSYLFRHSSKFWPLLISYCLTLHRLTVKGKAHGNYLVLFEV